MANVRAQTWERIRSRYRLLGVPVRVQQRCLTALTGQARYADATTAQLRDLERVLLCCPTGEALGEVLLAAERAASRGIGRRVR